jgi:hypothetical protein
MEKAVLSSMYVFGAHVMSLLAVKFGFIFGIAGLHVYFYDSTLVFCSMAL